jgi:hypothetical protein
MDGRER